MRYRRTKALSGERVVHNFPARGRVYGQDGFRYWTEPIEGAEGGPRHRCYCDWTEKVPEHYGSLVYVNRAGDALATRSEAE